MTQHQNTNSSAKPFLDAQAMGTIMWVLLVGLVINLVSVFGAQMQSLDIRATPFSDEFKHFTRAVMLVLPTLLFAWAVFDLARFFRRYEGGELFTDRNVKVIKSAGESLFWAAIIGALISPTVISWIDGEGRGFIWQTNNLTLGVAAMGIGLYGFADVLAKAVILQAENDEIV